MIDLTPKYFRTTDGDYLGLHTGRWDEHHRRRRTVLPERASSWDYAPLIEMIRPANRFREFRYVGITVHEWLEQLRSRRDSGLPSSPQNGQNRSLNNQQSCRENREEDASGPSGKTAARDCCQATDLC